MRILVVSDLYPPVSFGGYEMECATVVEHLRERHDVLVLTSNREATSAPPESGVARLLPYSGGGPTASAVAPVHAVRAARLTRRLLRTAPPDLVFLWNASAIPTAAVRVVVDHGSAVIHRLCERWFAEGLLASDHYGRYLTGAEEVGVRAAWGAVARAVNLHPALRLDMRTPYRAAISWNSDALRRTARLPPTVDPVLERVIHPATRSAEYFATLSREPSPRPSILFVGRLSAQKGAEVAVRALSALRAHHGLDADLVMAGPYDAAARARLERLAGRLGVEAQVAVRGRLDTHELGEELRRAHVMVAPSTAEAFGLACVEAARARVPVVASRVDGIPEALRDEEHAMLFPVGDGEACAAAIAQVLTDADGTRARVARALARAEELSLDRYLAATDEFIEDARAALGHGCRKRSR